MNRKRKSDKNGKERRCRKDFEACEVISDKTWEMRRERVGNGKTLIKKREWRIKESVRDETSLRLDGRKSGQREGKCQILTL